MILSVLIWLLDTWMFVRYMVDAADREKVEASRNELHNLLDKPQLQGIPVSACRCTAVQGSSSVMHFFTAYVWALGVQFLPFIWCKHKHKSAWNASAVGNFLICVEDGVDSLLVKGPRVTLANPPHPQDMLLISRPTHAPCQSLLESQKCSSETLWSA